jgi:O-succinylbenzoic acid--CoA ligase
MDLSLAQASIEASERPALVTDEATLTYRALAEQASRAAAWLRARNGHGGPVAVIGTNELATAVLLHALVALGIPPLLLDPRLSEPERLGLVRRAGAGLVVDPEWSNELDGFRPLELPSAGLDDERPLALVPTSGTTQTRGRLAVLSRRAFLASALASAQHLGCLPEDRWLVSLPLGHIGGLSILTRSLAGRFTAVLIPAGDTAGIAHSLLANEITLLSLVPAQLARLLDIWPQAGPPPRLRAILLGGDAAPASLLRRAQGWPVLATYGLTEGCSQVTCQPYGTEPSPNQGAGHPLPGIELRLVEGRIHFRGATLFSGYWQDASSPFDGQGWFETGDLARLDAQGRLHVLGRVSDLIVTGGEKVAPAEVERALESIPGVADACVFGIADDTWGELVAAALVTNWPEPVGDDQLRNHLRTTLARFKHPRLIAWVGSLTHGPSSKLDRVGTREQVRAALRPLR